MKGIRQINAAAHVFAGKHLAQKKAKQLMAAVTISSICSISIFNQVKFAPKMLRDEFVRQSSIFKKAEIKTITALPNKKNTTNTKLLFDWKNIPIYSPEAIQAEKMAKEAKKIFDRKKLVVTQIMEEDKDFTSFSDKDSIAAQIVAASDRYGINPVYIACIVKKESHFTPNINNKQTKGMMQITMGAVGPMFKYPQHYSENLNILKQKYNSPQKYFEALGYDSELNIETGTILFKTCLELSKGNLEKALRMYNGSKNKEKYARLVLKDIKLYEKLID